jgi:hypothetical protein
MSRWTDAENDPMEPPLVCSHYWIDPDEPTIHRARYSPIIGPGRREMKTGKTYRCLNCGQTLVNPWYLTSMRD